MHHAAWLISLYKPSIAYTLEAIIPLRGSIIVRLPAYVSCDVVAIVLWAFDKQAKYIYILHACTHEHARADRISVDSALAMQAM